MFMNLLNKNNLWYLLLILISLIGVFSFLQPGFFPSHDGEWMVVRFSDFHRGLADGQFPVRWAGRLNFGYGYPVFNFLYPGTFYLTEVFHLLKLNFVDSVKAAFTVTYTLSGIFMFLFVRKIANTFAALASAVLYLFTPYRFVDLYVRGSLGESVAFMFPPLICYFWLLYFEQKKNIWAVLTAFAIAGLILTHNVIAYLFLPVLFLFAIFSGSKKLSKKELVTTVGFFSLGVFLAAFFWIPALHEKQFTIFDQVIVADYRKNFPAFWELVKPAWNYGPSRPGDNNSMSFQIGLVNWLVLLATLVVIPVKKIDEHKRKLLIFFSVLTILAIFFLSPSSAALWEIIPGLPIIQFPWRILSLVVFSTAVLLGLLLSQPTGKTKIVLATSISIIFTVVLNFSYAKPETRVNREDGYYFTNDDTTTVQNEYLPKTAKDLVRERSASKVEIITGHGTITDLQNKSNLTSFVYTGNKATVKINTAYFPGWEVKVNEKAYPFKIDNQGLLEIKLNKGRYKVEAVFKETLVRKIANLISLFTLLILVFILIKA